MSKRPSPPLVQVVYTSGSGNGRAAQVAGGIARRLRRGGQRVRVTAFRTAPALAAWSGTCAGGFSPLIVVGGDSTVSAAAPAAMRHGVPLLPVPMGFGNLFAGAFALPADAGETVSLLTGGALRHVDAGTANGHVFLCHSSYGLLSDVERAFERSRGRPVERWKRHLAYYATAREVLFEGPLPSVRVDVDGRLLIRDAVIATVANVETYRGFLSLTPEASATDGWFDVAVMERVSRVRVWGRLIRLLLGLPLEEAGIRVVRARRVRVTVQGQAPELVQVLPMALPLIVPPAVAATIPASPPAAARARLGATRPTAPARWPPVPGPSTPAAALDAAG